MTSRSELSGVKIHSKVDDVRVNVIGNQPSMPRLVDFIPLGFIDEYDFVIYTDLKGNDITNFTEYKGLGRSKFFFPQVLVEYA